MPKQRISLRSILYICFLITYLFSANIVKALPPAIIKDNPNHLNLFQYWQDVQTSGSPSARFGHTSIWTGSEMIVWGGALNSNTTLNDGARYNPILDNWTPISTTNAPSARYGHGSVWTGAEMIIWGGSSLGFGLGSLLNDGARYNQVTDSWTPISITDAPSARSTLAIWTGSEMIIWGGWDGSSYLNDGARYNPVTDSWTPVSVAGAPSARSTCAIWTGSEMIIWGGNNGSSDLNDGARYNPVTDSWTPISIVDAPTARSGHTLVWTGSEMIVWGGRAAYEIPADGARYNPVADNWTPISEIGEPTLRTGHKAIWSGSEMIVWGGSSDVTGWGSYLNDGASYDPVSDKWMPLPITGTPSARMLHTAVWTGSAMIIWGGWDSTNPNDSTTLNTGALLHISHFPVYLPFCAKE